MLNKSWGKLENNTLIYAPYDIAYNDVYYSPATNDIYLAAGWKLIVASVPPYSELPEKMKWVKSYIEKDLTIEYNWSLVEMPDAEYIIDCHNKLNASDWTTTAYMEGELDEDVWLTWKAKRKVWRDFIRSHE